MLKRSVYAWKMLHPSCLCLKCLIFYTWVQNMLHDVHQWRHGSWALTWHALLYGCLQWSFVENLISLYDLWMICMFLDRIWHG
jgi:hypothetical protein